MARMHSRKKGKAGSNKPVRKAMPSWIRYKPKEAELLIVKLAKEGKNASQIGMILRDIYGIPIAKKAVGKKVTKVLAEHKLASDIPEDLLALIKKSIAIRKHLEENKQDEPAKRGLILTESKIRRLVRYYKRTEKLAEDWKFEPKKIRLYIE